MTCQPKAQPKKEKVMFQEYGRFDHLNDDELGDLLSQIDEDIDTLQHYLATSRNLKPAEIDGVRRQLNDYNREFDATFQEIQKREIDGFDWYLEDDDA